MKTRDDVFKRISSRAFGTKIIDNARRGDVAEELVLMALEPEWKLCSEGWHAWDLENPHGLRIQVRQSAALQVWDTKKLGSRKFTFAPATGFYGPDGKWENKLARHADIYIFAWHGQTDKETADQLDPEQWEFFVVKEIDLPEQKSVSTSIARTIWTPYSFSGLKKAVFECSSDLLSD